MNIGRLDQMIRLVLGTVLVALAATEMVGSWGYIGLVLIATGLIRWCGLYQIFGIQTCSLPEQVYKNK